MNTLAKKDEIHNINIELAISNLSVLPDLQKRLDDAEKNREKRFGNFSDIEIIQWFLYERKHVQLRNERTEKTIAEYKRELKMFVNQILTYATEIDVDLNEVIEGSLFKSLQARHLRRYQEWLATKSEYVLKNGAYSPATLERKTTILKSFFSYLYEIDYIEEPIYRGFKIATVRKDDRPNRDLGPKDVITLLNRFKEIGHPVMFTIIHVLTTTGIRNEEFCTLRVQDLKEDSIQGGFYLDVLGKGNKRRHIPVKDKVIDSIHAFRRARGLLPVEGANAEDPLFTTSTGRAFSPSYLSQYVKNQIEKLDDLPLADSSVKLTPHVFRHAFAIISKLNDVDIYDIMRSLGHEKIETTMIYLEKVFEKERHAIHAWKPEVFGEYI